MPTKAVYIASVEDEDEKPDLTNLFHLYQGGDKEVLGKITELVHTQLRKIAVNHMRRERPGHTLQPTALVNEAFLRLFNNKQIVWESRVHFYAIASQTMRQILVDHARKRKAGKRGNAPLRVSFSENFDPNRDQGIDLLSIHDALEKLEKYDKRLSQVVELRYFGGLEVEEVATSLNCSTGTVKRDWKKAKVWLMHYLSR